ncbi:ATP-binding protein [uncultured Draconibacterium sp.]|uniref:sensor histidine kinase n=1 Tax=uncultured Draconibacterium sp. TaxID=1573823 RepID=UPI00325FFD7C
MKKNFSGQIFFYYSVIFVIFTATVLVYQFQREKEFKVSQLENLLDNTTEIAYRFIEQNNLYEKGRLGQVADVVNLLPQNNTRITVIDKSGQVLFDSFVDDFEHMENHINRPEIQKAIDLGVGANIRLSATTNQEFYYFAKMYPQYFVRAALVYDVEVKGFLKTSRIFIVFIIGLFFFIGLLLTLVTVRLSFTIKKLKEFALKAGNNELAEYEIEFPDNELGVIGSQIITIYNSLKKTKDDLANEREKLFNHLDALDEAIAFFSDDKKLTLSNGRFVQIINLLAKKDVIREGKIFKIPEFDKLNKFINEKQEEPEFGKNDNLPKLVYTVSKNEKYYKVQAILFADKSFEIVITDVTRLEKRRLLKQQLTSNIAHELKTPLSSIRGYLETILDNWPIPDEKLKYFLEKAFFQSERLTTLINDVSLINNIEDAGELFELKHVDIKKVTADIYEYFQSKLEDYQIEFIDEVEPKTIIQGNESLLFSIFQNLMENSINYGGSGIKIHIRCYHQDEKYFYFSFFNSGSAIPEEHLPRLFERFYRVDKGRSRANGGTGLGLAIVKNAISLHKGRVSVKNRSKGGVEFLFSLSKI